MNRQKTILIIIASIILAACSTPQTAVPSATPTRRMIKTAVPTRTTVPTFTPTVTSTPLPGSLQSMQSEAGEMCRGIFAETDKNFELKQWETGFGPGTAAYINEEYENSDWVFLEPFSTAAYIDQVDSIICIQQSRINKGTYTTGGAGYQPVWDVWLLKWPDGKLQSSRLFPGGSPPATKTGAGSRYGKLPDVDLSNWLADLLQEPIYKISASIKYMAFSNDGATLIAGTGRSINFLQAESWEVGNEWQVPVQQGLRKMVYSPDKTRITISKCLGTEDGHCTEFELNVYDLLKSDPILTIKGMKRYPPAFAISPDGKTLAASSSEVIDGTTKSTIRLVDIASNRSVLEVPDITGVIGWILFTPDGSGFIYDRNRYHEFREVNSGEILNVYPSHGAYDTAQEFSPAPNILANSYCQDYECTNSKIEILDYKTGTMLDDLTKYYPISSEIYALAFSPDGGHLAVSSCAQLQYSLFEEKPYPFCFAGKVTIQDLASYEIQIIYPGTKAVYSLAFTPDQSALVTGDDEGQVKIWELAEE